VEAVRAGLRDLDFKLKNLNADQPNQPPAWVVWHRGLFTADQLTAVKAQLAETLVHLQPPPYTSQSSGAVGHASPPSVWLQ
jgi:hypothetical protein